MNPTYDFERLIPGSTKLKYTVCEFADAIIKHMAGSAAGAERPKPALAGA